MKLPQLATWVRVGNVILLGLLATYTFLAIATYSELDPAWSSASSNETVRNLLGSFGAYTADFLKFGFGEIAYLIPVLFVAKIGSCLIVEERRNWWWSTVSLASFLFMLCSLCLLSALWNGGTAVELRHMTGLVGFSLVSAAISILDVYVVVLIALCGLFFGSMVFLRANPLRIAEYIGAGMSHGTVVTFKAMRFLYEFVKSHMIAPTTPKTKGTLRIKPASKDTKSRKPRRKPNTKQTNRIEPTVGYVYGADSDVTEPASKPKKRSSQAAPPSFSSSSSSQPTKELLHDEREEMVSDRSMISINRIAEELANKLLDFAVEAEVVSVMTGPVVTRFEIQPAPGIKVSKISGLVKDLARALAVVSVRVVEVIPGKSVIGIEIPNEDRATVYLKQVLDAPGIRKSHSPLTFALGKDVAGQPMFADIQKMPHLLVAGTTGAGKSVCINVMLVSMLLHAQPDDLRLILIDPKMLELSVYDGIPHLLTPVVTDMQEASAALTWCIGEMERRYQLMAALSVRNLSGFNAKIEQAERMGEPILDPREPYQTLDSEATPLVKLPLIVVVVDEYADMMMILGKKVEQLIARLAQKARAAGIHLVLATQRPSVDVVTGLIKANIPVRISFQVSSQIDSRTVIDQGGAEQLLGHGDMLYLPPGTGVPIRIHGAFISDEDVKRIADAWRETGEPEYVQNVTQLGTETNVGSFFTPDQGNNVDHLYDEAVTFVLDSQRASISSVQRKFRIGYNRAARIIETMQEQGIVTAPDESGARKVVTPAVTA